ncbi:MAG: glycerol dehydratase reactivase beta/small subunit family protein [Thermotaleaceae bacterium]
MKIDNKTTKPHIRVYFHDESVDITKIYPITWGIEEEGIPYETIGSKEEKALELGYLGAEESNLGVGIGIGKDGFIVLHYHKLKKNQPLFTIKLRNEDEILRKLGANAARLVKGIPFKTI